MKKCFLESLPEQWTFAVFSFACLSEQMCSISLPELREREIMAMEAEFVMKYQFSHILPLLSAYQKLYEWCLKEEKERHNNVGMAQFIERVSVEMERKYGLLMFTVNDHRFQQLRFVHPLRVLRQRQELLLKNWFLWSQWKKEKTSDVVEIRTRIRRQFLIASWIRWVVKARKRIRKKSQIFWTEKMAAHKEKYLLRLFVLQWAKFTNMRIEESEAETKEKGKKNRKPLPSPGGGRGREFDDAVDEGVDFSLFANITSLSLNSIYVSQNLKRFMYRLQVDLEAATRMQVFAGMSSSTPPGRTPSPSGPPPTRLQPL